MGQKLASLASTHASAPAVPFIPRPSNKMSIVGLDLDGTLLQSDHTLHPSTIETLQKLSKAHVTIMLCTGRSPSSLVEVMKQLDLRNTPVCCLNGTAGFIFKTPPSLADLASAKLSFSSSLSPALIADTYAIVLASKLPTLPLQTYTADGTIYCTASTPDEVTLMNRYEVLTGTKQRQVTFLELLDIEKTTPFNKMLVLTGDDRVTQVHDLLKAGLHEKHECTLIKGSPSWFVEVLPTRANKGEGVKRMCKDVLGMDIENLIAFGDGNNDVEFIDFAGWGVSMKNGSTAAKAVADVVLPYTNDEHGVARTLEEYFEAGVFEQEQEEERGGGIMRQHASVKKGLN